MPYAFAPTPQVNTPPRFKERASRSTPQPQPTRAYSTVPRTKTPGYTPLRAWAHLIAHLRLALSHVWPLCLPVSHLASALRRFASAMMSAAPFSMSALRPNEVSAAGGRLRPCRGRPSSLLYLGHLGHYGCALCYIDYTTTTRTAYAHATPTAARPHAASAATSPAALSIPPTGRRSGATHMEVWRPVDRRSVPIAKS